MPNWICRRTPLSLGQTDGAFSKHSDRNALITKCDFPPNTSPHLRPWPLRKSADLYKANISEAIVRQPKRYLAIYFIYFIQKSFFFWNSFTHPSEAMCVGRCQAAVVLLTLHIVLDSTLQNPLILSSGQTDSHRWDVLL